MHPAHRSQGRARRRRPLHGCGRPRDRVGRRDGVGRACGQSRHADSNRVHACPHLCPRGCAVARSFADCRRLVPRRRHPAGARTAPRRPAQAGPALVVWRRRRGRRRGRRRRRRPFGLLALGAPLATLVRRGAVGGGPLGSPLLPLLLPGALARDHHRPRLGRGGRDGAACVAAGRDRATAARGRLLRPRSRAQLDRHGQLVRRVRWYHPQLRAAIPKRGKHEPESRLARSCARGPVGRPLRRLLHAGGVGRGRLGATRGRWRLHGAHGHRIHGRGLGDHPAHKRHRRQAARGCRAPAHGVQLLVRPALWPDCLAHQVRHHLLARAHRSRAHRRAAVKHGAALDASHVSARVWRRQHPHRLGTRLPDVWIFAPALAGGGCRRRGAQ
mmetsp:Transcript_16669/g.50423  ORF Transcript_16669/g.50423 Transcript_16669/m.50423 type:complete len:386 (+) Transcript_16669:537-1694(+)